MEMDSLLDPVIYSSHRSFFAAVEHRALEVLRPRPPGGAISIHHDWVDRYVMKYFCFSLMYSSVFLYFDNFVYYRLRESGLLTLGRLVEGGFVQLDRSLLTDADEYSVTRSLEAYLLCLFGNIMFNNSVDRILLPYAWEIADGDEDVPP